MRQSCVALCLLVAVAASAAAAPKFLSVWKAPEASTLSFAGKKVAAVVMTDDQSLQQAGEEALTRELTARNVQAMASYRMIPREEIRSAERARGWFERGGIDGVVVLRPVSHEKEKTYSSVAWTSGYYPSFYGYYGYGWNSVYIAPSTGTRSVIVVETLIYDVRRDKLVWAATSETRDAKNLQMFVKELVSAAVAEMKKMRLIA